MSRSKTLSRVSLFRFPPWPPNLAAPLQRGFFPAPAEWWATTVGSSILHSEIAHGDWSRRCHRLIDSAGAHVLALLCSPIPQIHMGRRGKSEVWPDSSQSRQAMQDGRSTERVKRGPAGSKIQGRMSPVIRPIGRWVKHETSTKLYGLATNACLQSRATETLPKNTYITYYTYCTSVPAVDGTRR